MGNAKYYETFAQEKWELHCKLFEKKGKIVNGHFYTNHGWVVDSIKKKNLNRFAGWSLVIPF
jgi:hypothetical protein